MILFALGLAADAATAQPQAKTEDADRRAADEMINRPSINPPSNGG